MRRKRIIEMSSFGDDPIKDLGFVVFPASAGLDQRDCLFCAFSLHLYGDDSCSGHDLRYAKQFF